MVRQDYDSVLALIDSGQFETAVRKLKLWQSRDQQNPVLANLLGISQAGLHRPKAALHWFRTALRLAPGFHDARKNLAQALLVEGDEEHASEHLQRLRQEIPEDAGVWYLTAQARMARADLPGALEAAARCVALAPGVARSLNLRALIRNRMGQLAKALEDYEAALVLNADDVETLVNISLPLARQGRHVEALAAVRRAVLLAPKHLGAHLRLAAQLVEAGETEAAREEYARVLDLSPAHAEALDQIVRLNSVQSNLRMRPTIEAALGGAGRNGEDRARLGYALAWIEAQNGNHDAAARNLDRANAEMAAIRPFDRAADRALTDRILARFPLSAPGRTAPPALPPPTGPFPIYVLGLPRSGTTLAEAILGAHPQVAALDERAAAGLLLYPLIDAGRDFDAAAIEAFRSGDQALLPALPPDTLAYVDKMPENYRLIGFLRTAWPNARFIHLRRDPRDIALSMRRGQFAGSALNYVYDFAAMAQRLNDYARTMAHWHRLFPDQIFDLSYERMVEDVSAASRDLAGHCGLDWHPAMARPDLASGAVLTMSAAQVRQPVHRRSVGGWRNYAAMLEPFISALDPALWPEIAPAA